MNTLLTRPRGTQKIRKDPIGRANETKMISSWKENSKRAQERRTKSREIATHGLQPLVTQSRERDGKCK